jgi:hypothetical protein
VHALIQEELPATTLALSPWLQPFADTAFELLHVAYYLRPWLVVAFTPACERTALRGLADQLVGDAWGRAGFHRDTTEFGDFRVHVCCRQDLFERWGAPTLAESATGEGQDDAPQARRWTARAAVLKTLSDFLRPQSNFVPRSIDEVVAAEHVTAYRGHMALAYRDFRHLQTLGLTDTPPGQASAPQRKRVKTEQAAGGIVFDSPAPIPVFLADFWLSGNPDDIVPVESLRGTTGFDQRLLEILARSYPDREAADALAGKGVPSKDAPVTCRSLLSTNHQASIRHHRFVDKMFCKEIEDGRMFRFGIQQSPVIVPSIVTPMGAVVKKTREGTIDPETMRPTADLSWPPRGYWLELLVQSPNASVDLDRDFPYIFMISAQDLIDQVLTLRYRSSPSGKGGVQ